MNRMTLYKVYWKMENKLVPELQEHQLAYEQLLLKQSASALCWLDLGCGHHLLSPWRLEQERRLLAATSWIVGVDVDFASLKKHQTIQDKVCATIGHLPFKDQTFDLVTSQMVFEHLQFPENQLREIARILKKGGRLCFHTPNSRGYSTWIARLIPEKLKKTLVYLLQKREADDLFPAFYRINTPVQIKRLAHQAGFAVEEMDLFCSPAEFAILPPIAFFELLWIKLLMSKTGRPLRTSIAGTLIKT
ncbi:class I SAM-dependent methyltransferase [candidate division KSB1 bacterium]|nr:class I SAM-dependent methyltransferase [candidate division KSB1 bacterium]